MLSGIKNTFYMLLPFRSARPKRLRRLLSPQPGQTVGLHTDKLLGMMLEVYHTATGLPKRAAYAQAIRSIKTWGSRRWNNAR